MALSLLFENGKLGGVALEVFDEEPVTSGSPLWDTRHLSMTAHISAVSHPLLIVPIFVDDYRRHVEGRPLRYVIAFGAGY